MLINLKNTKQDFALGLRWLTATRNEADFLKEKDRLSYGFINSLHQRKNFRYKRVVLTTNEHNGAVSLAGLLSEKYENLIFIHKLQEDLFWLCVVKNHEIWNDLDVGSNTCGDFISNYETLNEIISAAQDMFLQSEIQTEKIKYVTAQAAQKFTDSPTVKLTDIVKATKKYHKKYKIHWLQTYRKQVKRIIIAITLVIIGIIGVGYVYSTQNAQAREKARILKQQQAQAQAELEKREFISQLQAKIVKSQASYTIQHGLTLIGKLSFGSSGWNLKGIKYRSSTPNNLEVSLKRGEFGDILTFKNSFKKYTISESISQDDNSGTKILQLDKTTNQHKLDQKTIQKYNKLIYSNDKNKLYHLISIFQKSDLNFTTKATQKNKYNIQHTEFSITGDELWHLRKLQYLFENFPTAIITNIAMSITTNNIISWHVEGELYG